MCRAIIAVPISWVCKQDANINDSFIDCVSDNISVHSDTQ